MRDDLPPNRLGPGALAGRPGDNPLTARVTVNRLWAQLFGRGLVETSEDFGTQGSRRRTPSCSTGWPSSSCDQGWSLKAMLRLIVTSATYRQSSAVTPELAARDPDNRLLARGPRFRLEAEMVRDAALAASGLLSPKIGGPSVFPPQPDGHLGQALRQLDKWIDEHRRGPLPPRPLHLLAAHVAVPVVHDLRRPQPRALHRPPRPHEHAAAGADAR